MKYRLKRDAVAIPFSGTRNDFLYSHLEPPETNISSTHVRLKMYEK